MTDDDWDEWLRKEHIVPKEDRHSPAEGLIFWSLVIAGLAVFWYGFYLLFMWAMP